MTVATYTDEAGFVREYSEPLAALAAESRERRRRQAERDSRRAWAAMTLGSSLTVARALYRGRRVPREALDPEFRDRLVCWDGELNDDIVLDVLVLLDADLSAEAPAEAPRWATRRAA